MPNDIPDRHLGHKLQEAMELRGRKQKDVAAHFDVKPPTVSSDWIKFGRIHKRHIPRLVAYFELPYEWWFEDDSEAARSWLQFLVRMYLGMSERNRHELLQEAADRYAQDHPEERVKVPTRGPAKTIKPEIPRHATQKRKPVKARAPI